MAKADFTTFNPNTNLMKFFGLRTIIESPLIKDVLTDPIDGFIDDEPDATGCSELPIILLALAETIFTKTENNDFSSILRKVPLATNSIDFDLERFEAGSWVKKADLVDATYGTFFPLGFDADRPLFTGYQLDWSLVLSLIGVGIYRIKIDGTYFSTVFKDASNMWCLKEYSEAAANDTVRFDWTVNGIKGNANDTNGGITDYGKIDWADSIRVQGFFGLEESDNEIVEIEFQNGQVDKIRDESIRKYKFFSGRFPKWLHDRLRDFAFTSNELQVTDFNTNNEDNNVIFRKIQRDGGYSPKWKESSQSSVLARVEVEFKDKIQNLINQKCI